MRIGLGEPRIVRDSSAPPPVIFEVEIGVECVGIEKIDLGEEDVEGAGHPGGGAEGGAPTKIDPLPADGEDLMADVLAPVVHRVDEARATRREPRKRCIAPVVGENDRFGGDGRANRVGQGAILGAELVLPAPPLTREVRPERAPGRRLQAVGDQLTAVLSHEAPDPLVPVPVREVAEEEGAVEVAGVSCRPADGVQRGAIDREEVVLEDSRAQHHIVDRAIRPAHGGEPGLQMRRESFHDPAGGVHLREEGRVPPENRPEMEPDAARIIQMEDVNEFVEREQAQPVVAVGERGLGSRRVRVDGDAVARKGGRQTIRIIDMVRDQKLDPSSRRRNELAGEKLVRPLGAGSGASGEGLQAGRKGDVEVVRPERSPLLVRRHRLGHRVQWREEDPAQEQEEGERGGKAPRSIIYQPAPGAARSAVRSRTKESIARTCACASRSMNSGSRRAASCCGNIIYRLSVRTDGIHELRVIARF